MDKALLALLTPVDHREAYGLGTIAVGNKEFLSLGDPRARFMHAAIQNDGGSWSNQHGAYVFTDDETRSKYAQIVESYPWLPLDPKYTKLAQNEKGNELYDKLGLLSGKLPTFPDNPRSPLQPVFFAPDHKKFEEAQGIMHAASRATHEQVDEIERFIATGKIGFDELGEPQQDFVTRLRSSEVDQYEAKALLRKVMPITPKQRDEIVAYLKEGRLNDQNLGFAASDVDEKLKEMTEERGWDLINVGKKTATLETKRLVAAYVQAGAIKEGDKIMGQIDTLSEQYARRLLEDAKIFVSRDHVDQYLESITREGWDSVGRQGANGQRNLADGTAQGFEMSALERLTEKLRNNEIEGLAPSAKEIELPTSGITAGEVVYANGRFALLAKNANEYVTLDQAKLVLDKGMSLNSDLEGSILGIACRREGKPYVSKMTSPTVQAGLCEMDIRQQFHSERRDFVPSTATQGEGVVRALRGAYAGLLLNDGTVAITPLSTLSDPEPKFGRGYTFTAEGTSRERSVAPASPTRSRSAART